MTYILKKIIIDLVTEIETAKICFENMLQMAAIAMVIFLFVFMTIEIIDIVKETAVKYADSKKLDLTKKEARRKSMKMKF